GLAEVLKENGMYDPDDVMIQPISVPVVPTKPTITVAQVLKLNGDAKAGASNGGTCYTCHKIGKQGIEFGPDIVSFAKTQSQQAIVEAILHPSKTISHGYEGHLVETKEGNVEGIVLSRGNPVMVQSQGGILQMIPKNRVKKIRGLGKSLMWPSQLNTLDAQGIADLVAYLKTL
ncbi:MAG: putative heme-binding domain-containing protein, partial [Planctomycetota bacterium]